MMRPTLMELVVSCAPLIAPDTALALIRTESGGNPYAIGVVGNALVRQPRNAAEALSTANALERSGWDFSVGLGQINKRNFMRLGLNNTTAFDPCTNLRAMQTILSDCFSRAGRVGAVGEQVQLRRALSCYYSGNFKTGFMADLPGQAPYVDRVIASWSHNRTRGSPAR
jgi:type IV secretion system protein VirB1